jgi:hypothetical protein
MQNIGRYYKSAHSFRTSCASMPESTEMDSHASNPDMLSLNKGSFAQRFNPGETVDDDRRGRIWHPKPDLDLWRAQIFEQLLERGHSIEDPDFVRCRSKSTVASGASTNSRGSAESLRPNEKLTGLKSFGSSFKQIFQRAMKGRTQSLPF